MLGLGRALGETMAVTFVIGNTNRITTTPVRAGQHHRLARGARICREPGRQPEALGAAGARLHPVRDLLHRAGDLALPAALAAEGADAMSAMRAVRGRAPVKDPASRRGSGGAAAAPTRSSACAVAGRDRHRPGLPRLDPGHADLARASAALSLAVFTEITRPPGSDGGLLNAIVGSLIQIGAGDADRHADRHDGRHLPGGICAAARALGDAVRFVSDILLSAPSHPDRPVRLRAAGQPFGGFSGWAGVARAGRDRDPDRGAHDRGHAAADPDRAARGGGGARRAEVEDRSCWSATAPRGTASSPACCWRIARIAGETAPLLFTALGNLNWSIDLSQPMAACRSPSINMPARAFQDWVELAWVGALLITLAVLALNIVARACCAAAVKEHDGMSRPQQDQQPPAPAAMQARSAAALQRGAGWRSATSISTTAPTRR